MNLSRIMNYIWLILGIIGAVFSEKEFAYTCLAISQMWSVADYLKNIKEVE